MMILRSYIIKVSLLITMLLFTGVSVFSQADRKLIRKGNREYNRNNFSESEILYRRASDENKSSSEATFNIGDALYRQNKFEDAGKQFADNANQTTDAQQQSASWYNLGNSLLQANKITESIDAYKNSLKLNPDNNAAKYNLGFAQDLLQEQEQQQQQQQQQQQNRDKEQQNKDQQDQQKQDQQKENNENQQPQPNQQQEKQGEEQEQRISKEDAERLLNALANDEKEIQEKVKREKAARARSRTLKNW